MRLWDPESLRSQRGVQVQMGRLAWVAAVTLVYSGLCPGKVVSEVAVPPQAYQES